MCINPFICIERALYACRASEDDDKYIFFWFTLVYAKCKLVSYSAEEKAVGEKILQEIPLLAKVIESCGDDARNFSNVVHHVCAFIHIYLGTDIVFLVDQRNIKRSSRN